MNDLGRHAKFNPRSSSSKDRRDEADGGLGGADDQGFQQFSQHHSEDGGGRHTRWRQQDNRHRRGTNRLGTDPDFQRESAQEQMDDLFLDALVRGPRNTASVNLAQRDVGVQKDMEREREEEDEEITTAANTAAAAAASQHKQQVLKYQAFFRLFPKVNLEKYLKKIYKNKKKEKAPWQYRNRAEAETTSASSDTFYTAKESLHSVLQMEHRSHDTIEVAGEKIQTAEDLDNPALRTPLMMLLLLVNEVLILCTLIFLARWLVNYRGGVKLLEALWKGSKREPKHSVNLHAAAMAFCFAFCQPQVAVAKIFFEKFSEKTRKNIELCVRTLGFVAFVVGMQQIYSISPEHLPDHLEGPDKGIHLILSGAAIAVYLISTLNFMLNAIIFYYGGVKDTIVVGYLINLFLNSHVVETLGHLLDLIAFLSLLTGFLSYIILLFTASYYDLAHVFRDAISSDPDESPSEEEAYLLVVVILTFMYLTSVCIIFYQHNILYHNGIITYQMYKNNFKEIADALTRAKNQKEAIQEMADIECLCQYDNPQAGGTRVSQGGAGAGAGAGGAGNQEPVKEGEALKRRTTAAAAQSRKTGREKTTVRGSTAVKK